MQSADAASAHTPSVARDRFRLRAALDDLEYCPPPQQILYGGAHTRDILRARLHTTGDAPRLFDS